MRHVNGFPARSRGMIVVWGLLGSQPFGGMTWQVWHYVIGLRRLGFDVWYVEDTDRTSLDPLTFWPSTDSLPNIAFVAEQMNEIGMEDRWVYRPPNMNGATFGSLDCDGLARLYRDADAVINLCGAQEPRATHDAIRCRVYLQTDPAADQIRVASGDSRKIAELSQYDHLFTYGMNIHGSDCRIPADGLDWKTTRPPVCTDLWEPSTSVSVRRALTTVTNWKRNSKKNVKWQGDTWRWSKQDMLLKFIDLPSHAPMPVEMAVCAISDEDQQFLRSHGWHLLPGTSLASPAAYRKYIQESVGEFTVSKDQYVLSRSGWFSDRAVCYLAAGRPVITQDTRCGPSVPTDEGVLTYTSMDGAIDAMRRIDAEPTVHSRRAREIAGDYFEATRVIGEMMSEVGLM